MAHVKNYNPGHIRLDLPSANYIYELPLFAYSDTVGSLGISLIFNYHNSNESDNPFLFKPGYKLNIQKRLVIDSTLNKPTHFQNEYGKRVSLYKYDDSSIYFLDDESQRYVFKSGSFYVLVNPDDSRETYDLTGRFIFSEDKYFQEVLYCQYNTSGVLTKITYREKQIIFYIRCAEPYKPRLVFTELR